MPMPSLLRKGLGLINRGAAKGKAYARAVRRYDAAGRVMRGWQNTGRWINDVKNPVLRGTLKGIYAPADIAKEYIHGTFAPWSAVADIIAAVKRSIIGANGRKATVTVRSGLAELLDGSLA